MRRFGSILLLAAVMLLAGMMGVRAETPPGWSTDLSAALKLAETNAQPVLVYFSATWCGPCRLMARTTLPNPAVRRAIAGLECVAVDLDAAEDLARQKGVTAVPTFQMWAPGGAEVTRITGYLDVPQFLAWITNSVAAVQTAMAERQRLESRKNEAARLLRAADPASARQAGAALLEVMAGGDKVLAQQARAEFEALAARQPEALFEYLDHPRLAARILTANLLRARLGEKFDVDPWSDTATRRQAIARCRDLLNPTPEKP